jgi:hypothetical protein
VRALGRATLARQLLLKRERMPALAAVAHLVGMQAQLPLNPYLGLWSRLERFRPQHLARLMLDRSVVRIVAMRGTIHLLTADDSLVLRPLAQPVLDEELVRHGDFGPALHGVDLAPVVAFARPLLSERAMSGNELRAALAERFPRLDAAALAFSCRNLLPMVQVPPRGVWGRSGGVRTMTADSYLGRRMAKRPSIDAVVIRYFGAFGPATAGDVGAWSGLTGMREVVERLRKRLRPFRDERGRELFDLPDAPRPDPDTPAPPRFLPEYDNLLLSHADRSRFVTEEQRKRLTFGSSPDRGSVLSDGVAFGTWWIDRESSNGAATLAIDHIARATKRATAAVTTEGMRLLRFLAADATRHDVRLAPIG